MNLRVYPRIYVAIEAVVRGDKEYNDKHQPHAEQAQRVGWMQCWAATLVCPCQ